MRVMLIGAGNVGAVHAESLSGDRRVHELMIADTVSESAEELARRFDGIALSPDEAFDAAPDAVVIAAPTPAHAPLVRRCLEARVACFCEKPLSADLDESLALALLAGEGATQVQVGFMRRFDPALAALRELMAGGHLGRVHVLRVASHDHVPPPEAYLAASGGIFRDQLIHDFDMIRWISNSEVEWIYAAGTIHSLDFLSKYDDIDTCALILGLSSGELVVLTGTREDGRGEDVRIEAIGSVDSASAGLNARAPLRLLDPIGVDQRHAPYQDAFDRFADAYVAEMAHFLSVAEGRATNPCSPQDALQTLLVATAAERSRATNSSVPVQRASDLLAAGNDTHSHTS